jgi:hypothetical protein
MSVEPGISGGPPAGAAPSRVPANTAPVAARRLASPASVTLVQRRATDIVCGDVIALPDEVFHPVPARLEGRRTWMWRAKPWQLLTNPHRWRLVCETDHLDGDDAGIAASVPLGFRELRVSDDHPDQGQQPQSRVIAVREHDLIDVQAPTVDLDGAAHDEHTDLARSAQHGRPSGTVPDFEEFRGAGL